MGEERRFALSGSEPDQFVLNIGRFFVSPRSPSTEATLSLPLEREKRCWRGTNRSVAPVVPHVFH